MLDQTQLSFKKKLTSYFFLLSQVLSYGQFNYTFATLGDLHIYFIQYEHKSAVKWHINF